VLEGIAIVTMRIEERDPHLRDGNHNLIRTR
jgi:hypothetical protein